MHFALQLATGFGVGFILSLIGTIVPALGRKSGDATIGLALMCVCLVGAFFFYFQVPIDLR
jgi:hypothetical protein